MTKSNMTCSDHSEEGFILNIDKPEGITSYRVVDQIKKWTHYQKVGHAGTLDPMATGILLVCLGKATKQVQRLMELEKVYVGCIELGLSTDTDDREGEVILRKPVECVSKTTILEILDTFCGTIHQIPPMFSAVKRNGKRLYQLARKGITIPRAPRVVDIYDIQLLDWHHPELTIEVTCSKGTYIRALARDIGIQLQTGAYLKSLRRTRIGPYKVENALTIDQVKSMMDVHEDLSIQ